MSTFGNQNEQNPAARQMPAQPQTAPSEEDGKYVTDLDFISTWDAIHYEPSDVYVGGISDMFDATFDSDEKYPRGV